MNTEILQSISSRSFVSILDKEYQRRNSSNSSYSLRAYSRDLSMDPSTLSKILSGKRVIGSNLKRKLTKRLDITEEYLTEVIREEEISTQHSYESLEADEFELISDYHHYAILEYLRLDNPSYDISVISKYLGITDNQCQEAIDRLEKLEFIEINDDGEIIDVSGGKTTNITGDMKSQALRKMQIQLLEKSIECIEEVPYELRNNTSMTMAIDTNKIPEAIEEITKFRRAMGKLLSRGKKRDEVYNLSISLHPIGVNNYRGKLQ